MFLQNNLFKFYQKYKKYARFLYYDLKFEDISDNGLRIFLYDYFSPRSLNNPCSFELLDLIRGWEVLVSRHYFTNAIEMIFSYVLELLNAPVNIDDFIDFAIYMHLYPALCHE